MQKNVTLCWWEVVGFCGVTVAGVVVSHIGVDPCTLAVHHFRAKVSCLGSGWQLYQRYRTD